MSEQRIDAEFRAKKGMYYADETPINELFLYLAQKYGKPVYEIKRIIKERKGPAGNPPYHSLRCVAGDPDCDLCV